MGLQAGDVEVRTLDNGLRLVLAPSVTAGVCTVAVHIGVGFRSEPEGCSGLAHLFEHLMFQGSDNIAAGEHIRRVESVGGRFGGHTRHDYTELFQVVPSAAMLDVVRLEVDRLAGPRLDERTLRAQADVIGVEIAQQVDGVPFGGFPWRQLPEAMYSSFANVHDGYGDLDALAKVTVDDCSAFFQEWYAPHRVVVTLEGDLGSERDCDTAAELLSRLPGHPAGEPVFVDEAPLTDDVHLERQAANAPQPQWAAGFRLPDPLTDPGLYAGCTALSELLPAADPRLGLRARCGWYGQPLDTLTPDAMVLSLFPQRGATGADLLDLVRQVLGPWAEDPGRQAVMRTAPQRLALSAHTRSQEPGRRGRRLGAVELLYDDQQILEVADALNGCGERRIADAAGFLLEQRVGTMLVSPETDPARESAGAQT